MTILGHPWGHYAMFYDGAWRCVWCGAPCDDHAEIHNFDNLSGCTYFYDFCHCLKSETVEARP